VRGDSGFPVRLRFSKRGRIRFISHRDLARAFERAFRIQQLPLAFTRGFSPRPRVSFGLALPVGHESEAEYLDMELVEEVDVAALSGELSAALPEGIEVTGASPLRDRAPALQESVTAVAYRVDVTSGVGPGDEVKLADAARQVMESGSLVVTRVRKGREGREEIRPCLRALQVVGGTAGLALEIELATRPRGVRPADVLAALTGKHLDHRVLRTHQWIERGGARLEPLDADSRPRVPEVRAS
jgi:radical SAM-linked protein